MGCRVQSEGPLKSYDFSYFRFQTFQENSTFRVGHNLKGQHPIVSIILIKLCFSLCSKIVFELILQLDSGLNAVNYFTIVKCRGNKRYSAHLNAQISNLSNKLVCRIQKGNNHLN